MNTTIIFAKAFPGGRPRNHEVMVVSDGKVAVSSPDRPGQYTFNHCLSEAAKQKAREQIAIQANLIAATYRKFK